MCCTEYQWSFVIAYPAVSFSIFLLWWSVAVRPLRIFSVVLHEFSHGLAILLSCGTIYDVTVNRFEGGLIKWAPGCPLFLRCTFPIVAAAGYLGVSLFGTFLLMTIGLFEWRIIMLRLFSVLLILASLISFKRAALRFEATWILLFGVLSVICSMRPDSVITWYYILFSSSMLSIYASYDVYDDTVRRVFPDSDASHFSLSIFGNISKSRFIGRIWYMICIFLHIFGVIFTFNQLEDDATPVLFNEISVVRYILFLWGLVFACLFTGIDACTPRIAAPSDDTVSS